MYDYVKFSSIIDHQIIVSFKPTIASSRYLEQFAALGNVSSDLNPARNALTYSKISSVLVSYSPSSRPTLILDERSLVNP